MRYMLPTGINPIYLSSPPSLCHWSQITLNTCDETNVSVQGSQLQGLRILVGATVLMTGVMVSAKAFVDAKIPRPPQKPSSSKKKKKKKGSLGESLQVWQQLVVSQHVLHFLCIAGSLCYTIVIDSCAQRYLCTSSSGQHSFVRSRSLHLLLHSQLSSRRLH